MRILIAVFLALITVGCATKYDTEKSFWTGGTGFSETQLGPDLWQIDFTGNTFTDRDTTRKYVLRKAAEIADKHGYPYFVVLDRDTAKDIEGYTGGGYFSLWGGGAAYAQTSTVTTVVIRLLKEKPDDPKTVVYDAKFLLKTDIK